MSYFKHLATVVMCVALAACGGGGGSAGSTSTGSGSGSGSGSGTGGTTDTAATPKVTLALLNSSQASVSTIAIGGGFVARATVLDAAGAPVGNNLVTFSLNGTSIAALNPDTALTNASGVAEVAIAPASVSSLGAGSVTASSKVGTATVTGSKDFAVSATSLTLSALTAGSATLPSGGNTTVATTASIGGAPATVPVNVTFSATCGRINGTNGSFSVSTNGSGVATADYTAVDETGGLCSGSVTVTASSAGAGVARNTTITVAAPAATAVTFVSATPTQVFVSGSGATEQSILRFKVLSSGTPLPSQAVTFTVPSNSLGVGLISPSTVTNAQGEATVTLQSGTLPGPVKVRAALTGNAAIFAETQNLTIASGPPSQSFMSLSVETFNIEGATIDGVSTKLTARLADRQGNAVEDGTVVNFVSEGGQVAFSCATL
ncbi:MAG TPA: hypothetical protein VLJ86_08365, partial [Ramlibacter sp.]|nr:hypothetical protein [Ramlibacter sp.]